MSETDRPEPRSRSLTVLLAIVALIGWGVAAYVYFTGQQQHQALSDQLARAGVGPHLEHHHVHRRVDLHGAPPLTRGMAATRRPARAARRHARQSGVGPHN